jgi:hypothetical protein
MKIVARFNEQEIEDTWGDWSLSVMAATTRHLAQMYPDAQVEARLGRSRGTELLVDGDVDPAAILEIDSNVDQAYQIASYTHRDQLVAGRS